MSLGVAGVRAGHHTRDGTGVTVVLLPAGSVGAVEVRGGAPATRELAALGVGRSVERVDAVVLTGGSAFGLAAADGVMRFLAERGQGYPTVAGPVPIVPAAAVYDLPFADRPPDAADGYAAAVQAARGEPVASGGVGAGRGATVGKWRGRSASAPGGVGVRTAAMGGAHLAAIVVVNALGDVVAPDGTPLSGAPPLPVDAGFPTPAPFAERAHTTLVVVATDARLDRPGCRLLAETAHDGLARALQPPHTRFDGDVAFAAATGALDGAHLDRLRAGVVDVVADAVRDAVAAPGAPDSDG